MHAFARADASRLCFILLQALHVETMGRNLLQAI